MTRRRAMWLWAAMLCAAATARAESPEAARDYDTASAEWNGLATLAAVARGLGMRVEQSQELRWDRLGPNDALLLVYPTRSIDGTRLGAFLRRGGRAVIADDFGSGSRLLTHFGVLREPAGALPGIARFRDHGFAPIAEPFAREAPLAADIDALVTNHPAVFARTGGLTPVLGFSSGEAVVAAGVIGAGRLVALSDPSVLINRMLELEDNLQFAINLVRHLHADGRSDRLVVVAGDVTQSGAPPPPVTGPGLEGRIALALDALNGAADELREYLITEAGLRAAALALAGLVGILCLAAPASPRRVQGDWVRAARPGRVRGDRAAVTGGARRGDALSWAMPAAVLRDNLDRRLAARLGLPSPLRTFPERELLRRVDAEVGRACALALAKAAPFLAEIPARARASSPDAPIVSRRAFDKLYAAVRDVEQTLAAPPEGPYA